MAAVYANGANGVNGAGSMFPPPRYSDVPSAITISVADDEGGQLDVEIPLDEDIQDDPTELCAILENEKSLTSTWVKVAVAYAKHKKVDVAIDVLSQAINVFGRARGEDRLSILNGLCWLYLLKCREAPRIKSGRLAPCFDTDCYSHIQIPKPTLTPRRKTSTSKLPPAC